MNCLLRLKQKLIFLSSREGKSGPKHLNVKMTRGAQTGRMVGDLVDKSINPCRKGNYLMVGMSISDINQVILVGG